MFCIHHYVSILLIVTISSTLAQPFYCHQKTWKKSFWGPQTWPPREPSCGIIPENFSETRSRLGLTDNQIIMTITNIILFTLERQAAGTIIMSTLCRYQFFLLFFVKEVRFSVLFVRTIFRNSVRIREVIIFYFLSYLLKWKIS